MSDKDRLELAQLISKMSERRLKVLERCFDMKPSLDVFGVGVSVDRGKKKAYRRSKNYKPVPGSNTEKVLTWLKGHRGDYTAKSVCRGVGLDAKVPGLLNRVQVSLLSLVKRGRVGRGRFKVSQASDDLKTTTYHAK